MNGMLDPNKMAEATRLTRAGRLAEATALLQRMVRGESAPDLNADVGGPPLVIDATPQSNDTSRPTSERVDIGSRSTSRPLANPFSTSRRQVLPRLSAL